MCSITWFKLLSADFNVNYKLCIVYYIIFFRLAVIFDFVVVEITDENEAVSVMSHKWMYPQQPIKG
jgi:hypothetical protein